MSVALRDGGVASVPAFDWQPTAVEVAAMVDEMRPIIRAFAARAARDAASTGHGLGPA